MEYAHKDSMSATEKEKYQFNTSEHEATGTEIRPRSNPNQGDEGIKVEELTQEFRKLLSIS